MKWLGLRRDDLQFILEESLVPLKPKDLQIAKSLMSSEILPVMSQKSKRFEWLEKERYILFQQIEII